MRKNTSVPNKEVDMTSMADSSVIIHTSSESVPAPPSWFGEVALIVPYLRKQGVLSAITSQVRLARRRFGHDEVIDFLAVLFGYARSFERTLETFYERLAPWGETFMALFNREQLPSRSALSRFRGPLHPDCCRSPACTLSGGSARPPAHQRAAERRVAGSNERPVGGLRHRWHARSGPPTRRAEDGGPAP